MKVYRDSLAAEPKKPCVPFLPLHLKDLVFMNEISTTMDDEAINFDKLGVVARCISTMERGARYALGVNPAVQSYLKVCALLKILIFSPFFCLK